MHGVVEVFSFWAIHVEPFLDGIPRFIRQTVKKPSVGPGEAQKRGDPELRFPDEPWCTTFSDTRQQRSQPSQSSQQPSRHLMDSTFYFQHVNSETVLITDGKGRHCYLPQTKFAKVMFLHLSVSHSVNGGWVSASVQNRPHWAQTPPGSRNPPGSQNPFCTVHAGRYGQQVGSTHPTYFFAESFVCLLGGVGQNPPGGRPHQRQTLPPPSAQMPPLGRKIFCVMY